MSYVLNKCNICDISINLPIMRQMIPSEQCRRSCTIVRTGKFPTACGRNSSQGFNFQNGKLPFNPSNGNTLFKYPPPQGPLINGKKDIIILVSFTLPHYMYFVWKNPLFNWVMDRNLFVLMCLRNNRSDICCFELMTSFHILIPYLWKTNRMPK